jgi:hypothetical protein
VTPIAPPRRLPAPRGMLVKTATPSSCQRAELKNSLAIRYEGIGVRPELGDDKRHALGHEARHEGHVAREAVEPGHHHRATACPRLRQRCRELRPALQRIGTLAGLGLDVLG